MRLLFLALIAALTSTSGLAAEIYPSRPITIVLGTTRGGISDVTTRLYADAASKELGQTIAIENRPTDAGFTANATVQGAWPDGYTLFVFSGAQNAALSAIQHVPYDATKLFAPVTPLFTMVNFLAVRSDSPAHSVSELLDWGRTKPGGLVFGSSGLGSTSHLTAERLRLSSKTPIKPVHYAGAAPMIGDLLSGKLDFTFVSATVAKPYVTQGKLRLIAVDADERWPDFPDLPTLRQAGVNQPKVASWFALAAPAGTPAPVINRLHDAFAKAARDPAVVKGLRDNGAILTLRSPAETQAMLAEEVRNTTTLVQTLNLRSP
jgi:tripartite-type tricarboxylate transporter receptor subunit TctC